MDRVAQAVVGRGRIAVEFGGAGDCVAAAREDGQGRELDKARGARVVVGDVGEELELAQLEPHLVGRDRKLAGVGDRAGGYDEVSRVEHADRRHNPGQGQVVIHAGDIGLEVRVADAARQHPAAERVAGARRRVVVDVAGVEAGVEPEAGEGLGRGIPRVAVGEDVETAVADDDVAPDRNGIPAIDLARDEGVEQHGAAGVARAVVVIDAHTPAAARAGFVAAEVEPGLVEPDRVVAGSGRQLHAEALAAICRCVDERVDAAAVAPQPFVGVDAGNRAGLYCEARGRDAERDDRAPEHACLP